MSSRSNGYHPALKLVDLADPTSKPPTLCVQDRQLSRHAVVANATVQCSVDRWKSKRGPFAMTSTSADGSSWSRKHDAGDMSVFTKKNDKLFSILAVGEFDCSVDELQQLLTTTDSTESVQKQQLLWGSDVQEAEILHEIAAKDLFSSSAATFSSSSSSTGAANEQIQEPLYVKRVQFERPTASKPAEEWLYLDITTHPGDSRRPTFTKTVAAIDPRLVYQDGRRHGRSFVLEALAGIHVEAIDSSRSRVIYYGETRRKSRTADLASYNTIKTRLVRMAVCTSWLTQFVPRRSFASSSSSSNFSVCSENAASPATVCCSCCSKALVLASSTRYSRCKRLACCQDKKNHPKGSVCRSCDRGDSHNAAAYKYVKLSAQKSQPPSKNAAEQDPLVQMLQSTLQLVDSNSKKESMKTVLRYLAEQEAQPRPYYIV